MEKAYKTMKQVGALNIALGVITIVTGLVVGILMLTAGEDLSRTRDLLSGRTVNIYRIIAKRG